jgi:hypothetical protein
MIGEVSGTRDGAPWPGIGRDIDLPSDEAAQLIQARMAVPAVDPERAVQQAVAPTVAVEERADQRAALVKGARKRVPSDIA